MDADRAGRLAAQVVAGSAAAAARLISLVENNGPAAEEAMRALFPHTGRAYIVGVTGPPGSGKSTLVDAAVRALRAAGERIGVVAIDPTSPFSGGALLGDRVRMQDHSTDPEVFVRSMATRGSLGGLAPATGEAAAVLDAWGASTIFIETVGTGQAEVDVMSAADTVVVVTTPGLGDGVQAIKAGVMEIGDLFVVNKADRADADRAVSDLKMMLEMAPDSWWRPPVVTTVATTGEGVPRMLAAISEHRAAQGSSGALDRRRRERWRRQILRFTEASLRLRILEALPPEDLEMLVGRVASGESDPRAASRLLVGHAAPRLAQGPRRPVRVGHIGVAVRSVTSASRFYREVLGLEVGEPESLGSEGVRVAFVPLGEATIELLEPLSGEGPIARFLERRGEGIHHVAVVVPSVERALEAARGAGFEPIDAAPRPGAHGARVAFLHPKTTSGVLVELMEPGPDVALAPGNG